MTNRQSVCIIGLESKGKGDIEMVEIKEFGHFKCALGHEFDVTDCRLSAFDSKPCPQCGCASRIEYIFSKEIEKPRDTYKIRRYEWTKPVNTADILERL